MKSSVKALIAVVVFLGISFGLLGWSVWFNRVKAEEFEKTILTKLSADDVQLLLESETQGNPQQLAALKEDPESRQKVLEQLGELLALAAQARREGLANDPAVKAQLDLQEKILIASTYDQQQTQGKPAPPFGNVTPEEKTAYYQNPAHEAEFDKAIAAQITAIKAAGQTAPKLEGKQLEDTRAQFAALMITYDKATTDAKFMEERQVKLQIGLQQALALAREYANKKLAKEIEPTKPEIAAYLAAHPEYDAAKQRAKADDVLRRAKAGEDFAALANQFSEDPGNKDPQTGALKGGLYEDISQGMFQPTFETAALSVEPGNIVPQLVETPYGYHIIKLESKKVDKDKSGKEGVIYNVRHILLQNKFQAPGANPMGQPQLLSGDDIARASLGVEKRKKVLEEIKERNHIELPEDFTVNVPEGAADGRSPLPQNLPPGVGDEDDEPAAPVKKDAKTTPPVKKS